jgi:hypothetical protein
VNVGYPNGPSIRSGKTNNPEEVSVDKLKKQGNRNGFKLGSQMDHSTDEVDVMFMEGRILGKY